MAFDSTLARVSLRMARSLDPQAVLAEITQGLVRELGAAMARIWLVRDEEPDHLRLAASAGLSERLDGAHARVAIGTLKIGEIAARRSPVVSSDVLADSRFADKAWLRENAITAFAGYPLAIDERLLGVLAMFSRRLLAPEEIELLGVFAAQASVALENARLFARVTELTARLEAENAYLKEAEASVGIVGQSAKIKRVLDAVERVAPTTTTVLLLGETGTGKELFARAVHRASPRRAAALVRVNCAALAPTLIESELFGHEKGAFTGATARRQGRFELADGGTLFLDEVGELSLEAQAKLLRVLQEHEVERVGGSSSIPVDVRVIAATNRDLAADVKSGRFRADLYFRLAVFPIVLPSLRERSEDIPLLVESISAKPVDSDAVAYLQSYGWPGNVRELQNVLERAAILARGARIHLADLPELVADEPIEGDLPLRERVAAFERSLVADAMRRADGNQSEAARLLQTSRATLQYKLKTLGL